MALSSPTQGDPELGETTPLIRRGDGGNGDTLTDMKAESLKEKTVAGVAGVSFITSLLSLMFQAAHHPSVVISGVLGLVLAPYAALQQQKITQAEALSQTNDALETQVSQLEDENGRLRAHTQALEESVIELQAMEETLEILQSMNISSLQELEQQVHDADATLQQLRSNVRTELVQSIMTLLLAGDQDGNMVLSDDEIDATIQQLEAIQGVQVKEDLLRQIVLEHGRSATGVLEVARHVVCDDAVPAKQSIFTFVEG